MPKSFFKESEDDYKGQHQAPDAKSGAPFHNVTANGVYPEDFYSHNGFRYYSDEGNSYDSESHYHVHSLRNRPNASLKVYRAVPEDLPKVHRKINKWDWVTQSRRYAHDHGRSNLGGKYKIISKTVFARDIHTDGNSIHEWGYDPQPRVPLTPEQQARRAAKLAAMNTPEHKQKVAEAKQKMADVHARIDALKKKYNLTESPFTDLLHAKKKEYQGYKYKSEKSRPSKRYTGPERGTHHISTQPFKKATRDQFEHEHILPPNTLTKTGTTELPDMVIHHYNYGDMPAKPKREPKQKPGFFARLKRMFSEANWMYHGTTGNIENRLRANRGEYMIDRAIGAHFAADPAVSNKFAKGLTSTGRTENKDSIGTMFRARAPRRSELDRIRQKRYKKSGAIESDQYAIQHHVTSHVFQHHPEGKQLFQNFIARRFNNTVTPEQAGQLHDHLVSGQAPKNIGTPWDKDFSKSQGMRHFMGNWGYMGNDAEKKDIVTKYVEMRRAKGKKGLVYRNTSPNETKDKEGNRDIRSDKSYVIYDPESQPLHIHRVTQNKANQSIWESRRVTVPMLKRQLRIGSKVEQEHTDNSRIARKIAADHIKEFPDYYTRLKKMEAQAKRKWDK